MRSLVRDTCWGWKRNATRIALPVLVRDLNPSLVTRSQGRRVLAFTVREASPGLFVHVTGEVEFERVDIGFTDGSVEGVQAYGVERDSGLYELASFPAARSIAWVRLVLRARSRKARVGIKLAA